MECYTIIANPGENANTEINISWHTDIKYLSSKLYVTYKDDTNWNNTTIYNGSYYLNDVFDGNYSITSDRIDCFERAIFLHYHVEIKGLRPNTEYMYKVGEKELSDIHFFKTGVPQFSFAWVSDFHAYNPLPSRLRWAFDTTTKMIEKVNGVDFVFCGGDAIAWGGSYSFWKKMYDEPLVKNYLWANIIGNHDFMSRSNIKNTSAYFKSTNYFPRNGYPGEEGVCYHFQYGNTLFIVINNETMGFELDNEEVHKCKSWVTNLLKNNTCEYVIVCQHYEWFQGLTGASRLFGHLRFQDVFDEYHVPFVMGNNNHIYVRSHPTYQGKISYNIPGTIYIQSPSCDNERGQVLKTMDYNNDIIANRFSEGGQTVGVLLVKVTTDYIKVSLYDRNINVVDECFIHQKRKS